MKRNILLCALTIIFILAMIAGCGPANTPAAFFDELSAEMLVASSNEPASVISADSFKAFDGADAVVGAHLDRDALVWKNEQGKIEAQFTVSVEDDYNLLIEYAAISGSGMPISIAVSLDGEILPDLKNTELSRWWENAGKAFVDSRGDQFAPEQQECFFFTCQYAAGAIDSVSEPAAVHLTAGEHTLTIESLAEPFALSSIFIEPAADYSDYEAYMNKYSSEAYYSGEAIVLEGENARYKSTAFIAPLSDRSSPDLSPSNPSNKVINYIGSTNWSRPGEKLTWVTEVPESGLYHISFHYKQNAVLNGLVYRSLLVDGSTPFSEAQSIPFKYNLGWQNYTLSYEIYLEKGIHTLTLVVTLGDLAEEVSALNAVCAELGSLYRDIVKITGDEPDNNRDYNLFKQIPGMEETLSYLHDECNRIAESYEEKTGEKSGTNPANIRAVSAVLDLMLNHRYTAHQYKKNYYDRYVTLSALTSDLTNMPLSIDTLTLTGNGNTKMKKAGIFSRIWFSIQKLASSFASDYSQTEKNSAEQLTIWVSNSRDQMQVLEHLIETSFTPQTGINVSLKLSNASMSQGILSGNGPDLAINMSRTEPVNLALRGQMVDLRRFDDLDEVLTRFAHGAETPYIFGNGLFALPDTQAFNMLFYRTDIFTEMGLEPPKTWNDFIRIASLFQKNNMQVALSHTTITSSSQVNNGAGGLSIFPTLLMQMGGSLYLNDKTGTKLTSKQSIEAFTMWTSFYTDYKYPLTTDFYNRFRTGLIPMGIQSYTLYSTLSVTAPEIKGKWAIAEIPGIQQADGTIDRHQAGSGSGCGILKHSGSKEAAWEFLKWWTSQETQLRYSNNLESILGVSGRVATSNQNALEGMQWDKQSLAALTNQWAQIQELPELPGGYDTARAIDQAFWNVVNNNEEPRKMLVEWGRIADEEIARKRAEYDVK